VRQCCCKGDDASRWGNQKLDLGLLSLADRHQYLYSRLCYVNIYIHVALFKYSSQFVCGFSTCSKITPRSGLLFGIFQLLTAESHGFLRLKLHNAFVCSGMCFSVLLFILFYFIYYKVSYIKYRNIHKQRTAQTT